MVQLIEKKLADSKDVKGFIFGISRTLVQSYIPDGLLKKHSSSISRLSRLKSRLSNSSGV